MKPFSATNDQLLFLCLSLVTLAIGSISLWSMVTLQSLALQVSLVLALVALIPLAWFRFSIASGNQTQNNLEQLVSQLKRINNGAADSIQLDGVSPDLMSLIDEIQIHLAMETDRLIQEQNFSSDASHELRTPLAGMRLQAQIAQRAKDPEQRERALNNIVLAVDRSTRLVEQLLNYSRLSKRRTIAEQSTISLNEICRQAVSKYASIAREKQLHFTANLDAQEEIKIVANKDQITAMVENALLNSLQHAPSDGQFKVCLKTDAHKVTLNIEDSGNGINAADRDQVLVPFQRSTDGRQKGTGLGLAICQRVAQLHDGTLQLGDSELGGLQVKITLPLKP